MRNGNSQVVAKTKLIFSNRMQSREVVKKEVSKSFSGNMYQGVIPTDWIPFNIMH